MTVSSIPAMARASAAQWGDAPAINDGDARLSFLDVEREMFRVARALIASGVERGDRVALWAPNSAFWIPAALGIQATGAWLVPINTRFRGEEAAYALERVGATALITVDEFLGVDYVSMLRAAAPGLAALGTVALLPQPGHVTSEHWDEFLATGDDVPDDAVASCIDALTADDICDIILTSGTTGYPKGVMLRHGTSLRAYQTFNELSFQLEVASRQLVITPFFHCFGYKAGWMIGLATGAVTFPIAAFDPIEAIRLISGEKITHMGGSPTMYTAILDHPDRPQHDLSSLRTCTISAAAIPEQLVRRVRDEMGVASTLTGYGLTEHHAVVAVSRPTDPPELIATTAGQILDGVEARVVDDHGSDVPDGETGELLLRGPLVMSGYYGDDEATAAAIVDGWLHTGDIVRLTADRYVTITDRKKDIFIMGGFNVAPAEVERVLLDVPEVAQVAVVGAPDEHFGEVGVAFVVATPGSTVTADEVIAFARQHLANYKVPRRVEFVDTLPLNATGKVLKHELRARVTD